MPAVRERWYANVDEAVEALKISMGKLSGWEEATVRKLYRGRSHPFSLKYLKDILRDARRKRAVYRHNARQERRKLNHEPCKLDKLLNREEELYGPPKQKLKTMERFFRSIEKMVDAAPNREEIEEYMIRIHAASEDTKREALKAGIKTVCFADLDGSRSD